MWSSGTRRRWRRSWENPCPRPSRCCTGPGGRCAPASRNCAMRRRLPTMRCEEVHGLLDLYLEGELPEETARKVDRHLLRCPTCAYEARTLEQTRAMLREAVLPAETSPGFREKTAAKLLDSLFDRLKLPAIEH